MTVITFSVLLFCFFLLETGKLAAVGFEEEKDFSFDTFFYFLNFEPCVI